MRLTTFKVPPRHFQFDDRQVVFRHAWKGQDMYWIVPMIYVVSFDLKVDGLWHVRLSEAYWNVSLNSLAA